MVSHQCLSLDLRGFSVPVSPAGVLWDGCCRAGIVWIVQQGLPKMNLFIPGHASLEASHALLQTGHVDSCDFAVPPSRLVAWQ